MPLYSLILCLSACICQTQQDGYREFVAVCDAGSTGTRLYVFSLNPSESDAKAVFVKKVKPGLSSYAGNPADALLPLLNLLLEGAEKVPRELRKSMPLSIFGTAGMRLLPTAQQDRIWETVRTGLTSNQAYPFSSSAIQLGTISGNKEGLWAVYTANFLTGRMSDTLLSQGMAAPLGLMDLGGSSTQIAIPAASASRKSTFFGEGALVHSYLGFGMTYIREQVRKQSSAHADSVCYMKGVPVEGDIVGTGSAAQCRALIRSMMINKSSECQLMREPDQDCPGDLARLEVATDAIRGSVEFIAVAGMTYVVDFVHWWLGLYGTSVSGASAFTEAFPTPSLAELTAAVDAMCAGNYSEVERLTADNDKAHRFTGFDNAPFRCFQANYILVLLGTIYGFPLHGRTVSFMLDVGGQDLEWPLGAALDNREQVSAAFRSKENIVCALAACLLGVLVGRHIWRTRLRGKWHSKLQTK